MKYLYLIQKCRSGAWGLNPWVPHMVFFSKKNADDHCKNLNAKAQRNQYEVFKVLNGDFREFFYE